CTVKVSLGDRGQCAAPPKIGVFERECQGADVVVEYQGPAVDAEDQELCPESVQDHDERGVAAGWAAGRGDGGAQRLAGLNKEEGKVRIAVRDRALRQGDRAE